MKVCSYPICRPGTHQLLHIRMITVGQVDGSPSAQLAFIAMIEILNAVKIMQIPHGRGMFAIDFQRVERFVAARIASGLKGCERSVC